MQIVPSTFIALAAIALLVMRGPQRGLWVFLALTPLGAAAAFNLPAVGGASIGVVQLAVVAVVAMLCLTPNGIDHLIGAMRPGQPGFWLALLLAYATLSAIYAPAVFRGETDVFSISRSANVKGIISTPLRPSAGNITQLFRLTLGVLAFFAFATVFRLRPDGRVVVVAMAVATGVHVTLGWLDVISYSMGAGWLLDPIRTANYAILDSQRMIGLKRMIGGFPEASAFGAYSLALFAFWLQYWMARPGERLARLMLIAAAVVLLRSTSSGAYVSLSAFVFLWGSWLSIARLRQSVSRQAVLVGAMALFAVWLVAGGLVAGYHFSEPVAAFLDRSIFDKLGTRSGIERMSWNAQAFRNFLDTGLFGAGLGSVRASNWLVASLGSIGLIGTGLYLTFLTRMLRAPTGDEPVATALKVACFALLLNALLTAATPNLGVFFFAMAGLATGLGRGGKLAAAGLPDAA